MVTTSSGSALHIGKTGIVTKEVEALGCCFSNFMQRLRVGRDGVPRFVWHVVNGRLSRRQFMYLSSTTTGLANLNGNILGQLWIAVPPPGEQTEVVRFLDRACNVLGVAGECARRQIALAEELRTRLISDVVTGKLDVRGMAPLPESEAGLEAMVEERQA